MIEVTAILVILAVAGLGSRYLSSDKEKDKHSLFCLGICAHVQEDETAADPNEPADNQEEEKDERD